MFDAVETEVMATISAGTAYAGPILAAVLGLIIGIGLVKKITKKSA